MDIDTTPEILIVDDEPKNLYVLQRLLSELEITIVEADSGQQALKLVLAHDFFLIIMDVQMPVMDGLETAELIRSNHQTAHVPILFATANNRTEAHALKGYELGAVDYIYKPVNPKILTSKITVFKQFWLQQQELKQKNNALAQLNDKLAEHRIMLQQTNQQLNDFAHIASHDIKGPLGTILNFTERVLNTEANNLSDRAKLCLNRSVNSTKRLLELLESLLNYATAAEGDIERLQHDLTQTVNAVLEDMSEKISAKNAQITVATLPTIECDPQLMYQMFLNLVGNAIKYQAEDSTPNISIGSSSTTLVDAHNNEVAAVCITVEDNGIGFDESQLDAMLTPFQRLDNAEGFDGSGVGMGTVKRIVDNHQGTISATSQIGKGSTFFITLPLAPYTQAATPPA